MESNYKPNSHKFKEAQKEAIDKKPKKVEKVVTGAVKTKKKSEVSKVKDLFLSDAVTNIKSWAVEDFLVPTIKDAVWAFITGGLGMALFGERGRSTGGKYLSDKITYRNYNSISSRRDERPSATTKRSRSYDDVIMETRGDAEKVLDQLTDMLEQYGMVSVADLYDLVGITGEYTANRYGWTNLSSAKIARVREGYLLELPRAYPLELH